MAHTQERKSGLIQKIKRWQFDHRSDSAPKYKRSAGSIVADVFIILILLGVIFVSIIPMWHTLMASISDGYTLLGEDGLLWLPVGKINIDGYKLIFASREYQVVRGFINSVLYVAASSALGFVLNVIGGFVLSRQTKLRLPFTLFIMFTMMFSGGMVPTYMVLRSIGFTNNPLAIIIPGCTNAMFMVLAMNSFLQVPEATIEAAKLDGAKNLRIMFQIALPQGLSLVLVALINSIIIGWNSWFEAMIYLGEMREFWPLQLWIKEIVADSNMFLQDPNPNYVENTLQHVVVIVSTLPLFLAFPFFIKKLEKGMILGGVKE